MYRTYTNMHHDLAQYAYDWAQGSGETGRPVVRSLVFDYPDDPAVRYFAELAAAHEEMHCEAFTYTRQTHGYAAPRDGAPIVRLSNGRMNLAGPDAGRTYRNCPGQVHAV